MSTQPPEVYGRTSNKGEFDVFLSHRYKSPEVNLHFYETISAVSPITFRIDRGTVRTNTTRLERLVRDADAFIGIYPIPGDPVAAQDRVSLLQVSRYFRLEFDMAVRSKKPAAIFYDRRYSGLFGKPANIMCFPYDAQDIGRSSRSPAQLRLRRKAEEFFGQLAASVNAEAAKRDSDFERDLVGVLLPGDGSWRGVDSAVRELLLDKTLVPLGLSWPPRLDPAYIAQLGRCDWVVLDTSTPAGQTLLAFLHGQFVPTLRVQRTAQTTPAEPAPSPAEDVLFGAMEVGYAKDVVSWRDTDELLTALAEKIDAVRLEPELIGDSSRAAQYFTSAAKRKERVFLSYAGEDSAEGALFATELNKHFQEVFDYRATGAIRSGEPWLDQIFENLSASAVGVLLISAAYIDSGHCMDEARWLYDASKAGKVHLLPVKLGDAAPPAFLTNVQYERRKERTPREIVNTLVATLQSGKRRAGD